FDVGEGDAVGDVGSSDVGLSSELRLLGVERVLLLRVLEVRELDDFGGVVEDDVSSGVVLVLDRVVGVVLDLVLDEAEVGAGV
ncbi:hypothetical protein H4R27_006541, partial [Coemansia aciculifera]